MISSTTALVNLLVLHLEYRTNQAWCPNTAEIHQPFLTQKAYDTVFVDCLTFTLRSITLLNFISPFLRFGNYLRSSLDKNKPIGTQVVWHCITYHFFSDKLDILLANSQNASGFVCARKAKLISVVVSKHVEFIISTTDFFSDNACLTTSSMLVGLASTKNSPVSGQNIT